MELKVNTEPAVEPFSLDEVKKHLRLAVTTGDADIYTEEDDFLNRAITTARRSVELRSGRALITQTWEAYLDRWPTGRSFKLPYPPLVSATVTYRLEDDSGYDNTLSTVVVDTTSEPGRIVLDVNERWPTEALHPVNPIKITFVCGYGDAGSDVPSGIISAIMLLISDLYEHRGETMAGVNIYRTEAVDALLQNYRIWSNQ